jgi:hypothetical protein
MEKPTIEHYQIQSINIHNDQVPFIKEVQS